ncbi:MAG: hypothetical protein Q7S49_02395 [bacterium]|nr:hypothetical protein [bacterium]
MLTVRQNQFAQIPENVVNLVGLTWTGLQTELLTEVENEGLGIPHLYVIILLPKENPPHYPVVVGYRFNSLVGVDDVPEHIIASHPALDRLAHVFAFRDEWVELPLSFYPLLYYKI